jgi:hypothetical protein
MVTAEVERHCFLLRYLLRLSKQLNIDCGFSEVQVEAEEIVECCV